MKSKWLIILAGSALAFVADYPPFREAVRARWQAAVDDIVAQVQYRAAIERTLDQIRHLPESKEAE